MQNKSNELFQEFFDSCLNGIRSSKSQPVKNRVQEEFGLDINRVEVGYCSGQFHHRENQVFKRKYASIGILTESDANVNNPESTAYSCFGKEGIVLPLRNEIGEIVNFIAFRLKLKSKKIEYLNSEGIFPRYPESHIKRIFITTDVWDASVLISSNVLGFNDSVIALDEGEFKAKHKEAIGYSSELEELVFCCPDAEKLASHFSEVSIRMTDSYLDNMSLKEFYLNHDSKALNDYLNENRIPIGEDKNLDTTDPKNIRWTGQYGSVRILGGLDISDSNRLIVDLYYKPKSGMKDSRIRVDLMDYENTNIKTGELGARLQFESNKILNDIDRLRDDLTEYRDTEYSKLFKPSTSIEQENRGQNKKDALKLLKQKNLLQKIDKSIANSGLVGEQKSRLLSFIIAVSYKTPYPLHGVVKGTSASGKSTLVNHIKSLIPTEDTRDLTSGSNQSLSYDNNLINKLMVIQDFDGLGEKVMYDFRELQSNKSITRNTVAVNRDGDKYTESITIEGGFSSLGASTKALYHDNETRSILLTVDESEKQTISIQKRQNELRAGLIDIQRESDIKLLIRNSVRNLKSYEVVNPYAVNITLPTIPGLRRVNSQFLDLISNITILNQYQRELNSDGILITELEDVENAIDIFINTLYIKADDLDSLLRTFYNTLCQFLLTQPKKLLTTFKTPQIRKSLGISNTGVDTKIKELKNMGYIKVVGGSKNLGYEYELDIEDGIERKRKSIKEYLDNQLKEVKENTKEA